MTEQEQREIKAGLIELGFWGAGEPGDPTVDVYDAAKLHDYLQAKLADGVFLISMTAPGHSAVREVTIFPPGSDLQTRYRPRLHRSDLPGGPGAARVLETASGVRGRSEITSANVAASESA